MTQRIVQAEPTAEQIERGLKAPIPGGSQAWHWFLPHDTTPKGAANVRDVVRRMFLAMTENCPEVNEPDPRDAEIARLRVAAKVALEALERIELFSDHPDDARLMWKWLLGGR